MRSWSVRLWAVAIALGLLAGGCTQGPDPVAPTAPVSQLGDGPASAAPAPPLPTLPAGVTQRAVIGDPWSSRRRSVHAVAESAMALVRSARRGQTLTLSMFNLTYPGAAQALIRASRRGVAVRVLLNSENPNSTQARILRAGLGVNTRRRSFVVLRTGGIRMHAKFLLLTPRAGRGPVVWVSSGNLTNSNGRDQANEAVVTTGDAALYDVLLRQFTLMRRGVTKAVQLARTATTASAVVRTFPLPRGGAAHDPILAALRDVSCRQGFGRTTIRLAHLFLTIERIYLVRRLRALAAAGCDVRMVGHMPGFNPGAITGLRAEGAGRVDLRAVTGTILHTKITTVDGWDAAGHRLNRALVGSHNLSGRALTASPEGVNDELSLQLFDPATVDAYSAWVDKVIAEHSTRARVR